MSEPARMTSAQGMDQPFSLTDKPDDRTPLQRFLDGCDDIDLSDLRIEINRHVIAAQALREAYNGGANLALAMSRQAGELAGGLFGAWHPDPFVRGMLHGEGYAWSRCQAALETMWNALKTKEHAEVKGE